VFVVTIVIGILNGLDVVEFNRDQLLTHVHSGTLGWLTLAIVAASAWLAGGIDRRLAYALAVLIPIYVLAFYLAIPWLRAAVGGVLLLAIVWLVVWAWQMARANPSLPRIGVALGPDDVHLQRGHRGAAPGPERRGTHTVRSDRRHRRRPCRRDGLQLPGRRRDGAARVAGARHDGSASGRAGPDGAAVHRRAADLRDAAVPATRGNPASRRPVPPARADRGRAVRRPGASRRRCASTGLGRRPPGAWRSRRSSSSSRR
jgi:hypothetical protein